MNPQKKRARSKLVCARLTRHARSKLVRLTHIGIAGEYICGPAEAPEKRACVCASPARRMGAMSVPYILLLAHTLGTAPQILSVAVDLAAGATATVISAPGAGKRLVILGGMVSANVAGTLLLDSDTDALTGTIPVAANGSRAIQPMALPKNRALRATTATATFDGSITYAIV